MGSGRMTQTLPMFTLRDYQKRDFETLFKLDRLCFDPGIAYSRPELASFIEQRRAYTVVAEWTELAPDASTVENGDEEPELDEATFDQPTLQQPVMKPAFSKGQPRPPRRPIAGFVTFH